MLGQLRIRPVDLRVIQVRLVHPGPQVVRHEPGRAPRRRTRTPPRGLGPRPLVHPHHRPHEHVPRAAQHHHERPHRAPLPGRPGRPSGPAARSRSAPLRPARPGAGAAPVTWSRRTSSGRFAATYRRKRRHADAPDHAHRAAADGSSPSVTPAFSWAAMYSWCLRSPARSPAAAGYRPAPGTTPAPAPPTPPGSTGGPPGAIPAATAGAMYLRIVLRSTSRLGGDLAAATGPHASGPRSRSHRPRRTFSSPSAPPPSQTGGKAAPSRWPGPPRHARRPHGELRERVGNYVSASRSTGGIT